MGSWSYHLSRILLDALLLVGVGLALLLCGCSNPARIDGRIVEPLSTMPAEQAAYYSMLRLVEVVPQLSEEDTYRTLRHFSAMHIVTLPKDYVALETPVLLSMLAGRLAHFHFGDEWRQELACVLVYESVFQWVRPTFLDELLDNLMNDTGVQMLGERKRWSHPGPGAGMWAEEEAAAVQHWLEAYLAEEIADPRFVKSKSPDRDIGKMSNTEWIKAQLFAMRRANPVLFYNQSLHRGESAELRDARFDEALEAACQRSREIRNWDSIEFERWAHPERTIPRE